MVFLNWGEAGGKLRSARIELVLANKRIVRLIQFILCAVIFFLSVWKIESDPPIFQKMEDLTDEMGWSNNARNKVLFGEYFVVPGEFGTGYFGAPIFTLLVRVFFELGGVNLFSMRLLPVVCFWGTLLVLYRIFRWNGYTELKSMVPVAVFGLNHQILIHARWSTPILLEILFFALSFALLFRMAQDNFSPRQSLGVGAGICLGLGVASKITSLYMVPVFLMMFGVGLYLMRIFKKAHFISFCLGLLATLGGLCLFFLLNFPLFRVFVRSIYIITKYEIEMGQKSIHFISGLGLSLLNDSFANPMVFLLWIGVGLFLAWRIIQQSTKGSNRIGFPGAFDLMEKMAFLWLGCGICVYTLIKDFHYRRFVVFLVPLSILFSKFILAFDFDVKKVNPRGISKCFILTLFPFLSVIYGVKASHYVEQNFLVQLGFSPFSEDFLYLVILAFGVGISILAYLWDYWVLKLFLTCAFFGVNLGLNFQWLRDATFTVRDESLRLRERVASGDLGTGYWPWLFLFQSKAKVIYYEKTWPKEYNFDFDRIFREQSHDLFVVHESRGDHISPKPQVFLGSQDFPGFKATPVGYFRLAPIPGTSIYRAEGYITRISRN